MNLTPYLQILQTRFQTGISREHSYRGDLQTLLSEMLPGILITNEPARIECGAPDYILTKKDIPVGYIEAKDIGVDLGSKSLKEQFDRYRASLDNLIFTDYLDFHFYKDGNFVTKIAIAEIQAGRIVPLPDNFDTFTALIINFADTISQTIKSPNKLAEMMASRAKLMADVIEKSLDADDEAERQSALKGQMLTFKSLLIHDITNRAFADLYAQTIAYGLFAARYHDPTLPTFSRQEAATLIPKSNPFLRKLFQDIAGYDLDERLVWIVDELVQIFLASDVAEIMHEFGSRTKQEDPVIHFYETFLAAYDPKLRKARGVWYTPEPVVNFIVRAVDDILKTEFGIAQGLADTSKTKITTKVATKATADRRSKLKEVDHEKEVHRVQILDPATGTGTFLAEVVKHIHKKFKGQQGIWSKYVENDLIPRLHGFELLMASYAMAHLKLDMLLTETGYKPTSDQRFKVYLTNSLEESHPDTGTLFASWLSEEANEANQVKRETPVMVVLGNPPYSVSSTNKSPWIENLLVDYKKDLNEKNLQPLSDDYIKFIRFGQYLIKENGEGILAYISNNGFLEGIIHRQMRKSLLEAFDKIYILDLHGNSKKKEVSPDGTSDHNVFDIMQGVSISVFIKKRNNEGSCKVQHFDLYGNRDNKYKFLNKGSLSSIVWSQIKPVFPNYIFVKKDQKTGQLYETGFMISDAWKKFNPGVETGKDVYFTALKKLELLKRMDSLDSDKIHEYNLKDTGSFKLLTRLKRHTFKPNQIISYLSKPFDFVYCYYDIGILRRASFDIQQQMMQQNVAIICKRGRLLGSNNNFSHVSITKSITDKNLLADQSYIFPLYIYSNSKSQSRFDQLQRVPNLNDEIVQQIAQKIDLKFTNEKETNPDTFAPIDLLDYIYAVLHSPTYRETYKEFLKIDFPRVPYPKDAKTFLALAALGSELRQVHLLESPVVENYITQYPEDGDNVVGKIKYSDGKVYINETQYFANVPPVAWEFYIGGYQPAQKWLKDRKGRALDYEDILHYQKIIVALAETDRLMGEVDKIGVL